MIFFRPTATNILCISQRREPSRKYLVSKFPFFVIYQEKDNSIIIVFRLSLPSPSALLFTAALADVDQYDATQFKVKEDMYHANERRECFIQY